MALRITEEEYQRLRANQQRDPEPAATTSEPAAAAPGSATTEPAAGEIKGLRKDLRKVGALVVFIKLLAFPGLIIVPLFLLSLLQDALFRLLGESLLWAWNTHYIPGIVLGATIIYWIRRLLKSTSA